VSFASISARGASYSSCLSALGLLFACSDSATVLEMETAANEPPAGAAPSETPSAGTTPAAPGTEPSVYALLYIVWSDAGPTSYVALSDSLDISAATMERAREFPGYGSIAVIDGQLLVSSGDAPSITRFQVGEGPSWEEGPTLSFANQGVLEAGFFQQYLLRGESAQAELEVTTRVVWDPTAFEIRGVMDDSSIARERDGLTLFSNYNRAYHTFQDRILRPFSYHDEDWYQWASDTQIAVYDATTQAEARVLDVPCPALDTLTQDELGNTYLSSWEYPALHGLAGRPAPCVARLTPEGELDTTWSTDLTPQTGGRQVKLFYYLGDGRAVGSVLHAEDYGDIDFASLDPDAFWEIEGQFYKLWLFDLESQTARPLEGVADGFNVGSTFSRTSIDGRTFLFLGAADSSTTKIYELDAAGNLAERFESPGLVYQWLKVR
jgi:hypothetical protein